MSIIPSETVQLPGGRRILGANRGACVICDADVQMVMEHPGRRQTRLLIGVHGPRKSRCEGSRSPGRPWHEACHLPGWGDLSDSDKGQALMFNHKCWWEQDYAYARENYPPRYTHPSLADLPASPPNYYAARHSSSVVRSLGDPLESVPNFWAAHGTQIGGIFGRSVPEYIPEPLTDLARRVLGDEWERLMTLAGASFNPANETSP